MPLITPILDDRSFEDLFAELRNRIPVYNPGWTDHLDSDPGITLLQLFAYLGEGLQFRFNQIPEATQLAYLKLLGIPLRPAAPARALVRFTSKLANGVAVYGGDQLKAGKTVFTLSQDLTVWPLDCVAVARQRLLGDEGKELKGFMAQLDPELQTAVQGSIDAVRQADGKVTAVAPYALATLESDGSSDAVDFSTTVDHCVWVAVLVNDPKLMPDPATDIRRVSGRTLDLALGYAPAAAYPGIDDMPPCGGNSGPSLVWQASLATLKKNGQPDYMPVRVAGDTSAGFTRAGVVRLELPSDLSALGVPQAPPGLEGTGNFPPMLDDERAEKLWFWLRAWRGDGSRIGATKLIMLNAAACEQSISAAPELLGSGIGQPGQVFQLAHAPLLLDERHPVELEVEEGGVWTRWTQVESLDASSHAQRHFSVDAEAGTVHFGERFPQLGERIRVTRYRWGGGSQGNVPADAIGKFADLLPGTPPAPLMRPNQAELKLGNPLPATGGDDSESIATALQRIPGELRRNRRCVARDDFAELALQTPGVSLGRAECLPLFHAPSRKPRPGNVSVVIWPTRDPQHPNAPLPDNFELAQVCNWLDRWRLVTTELYVIPPTYRRIALAVSVKVKDGYGLDAVRDWLEVLLRQYLSPLPPYGPDGRGWPLGRRIMARELQGVAMQVEGVEYIENLRLDSEDLLPGGQATQWVSHEVVTPAGWEVPEIAAITVVDHATPLPAPGEGLLPPPATPPVPVPVLRDEC